MRVRGRSEFFLPSYTRCARSISMLRPFREGIHLERLILRKPATSDPSIPSGNPTNRTLFLLLLSSISVIFSVSRSSWFLKSVTAFLSSRVVAWTDSTRSRVCFAAAAMASNSSLSSLTELLVACISSRSLRNAGISTESTASLTAEVTTESKVLCCSLNASLIPLAIASSISSLEMVESLNFIYWRLPNLSFPIAFDCWSTHDESDAKWFEIYWQDNKIFDKVSRAKDYACTEVEVSRDLSVAPFWRLSPGHKMHTLFCISRATRVRCLRSNQGVNRRRRCIPVSRLIHRGDVTVPNFWIKSLFLFYFRTKSILVAS